MLLRKRIFIGYGITLFLIIVVVSWAVLNLINLGTASNAILSENYKSILAAEKMIDSIDNQNSAVLLVILDYDDEGNVQFRENENDFLQWLGRAKDNITIPGEADILSSIESAYSVYLVSFSKLNKIRILLSQNDREFFYKSVLPSFSYVREEIVRLREINQETMFTASRKAEVVAHTAILSTICVASIAVGLGLGFSLLLSKRLVRPIQRIMEATEELSRGKYEIQVPADGTDELARLAEGFNVMANKLGIYHRLNIEKIMAEKRKSDAVLRSIEDGVVVIDADLRVVNMNPQAGCIFNVDSETISEKHFLEVTKSEHLFNLMKQTAESGQPPKTDDGKNIFSIGEGKSAKHYMFGITPVIAKGGGMLGVVLVLRDVTRLKELDKMKSEFVMTASHELKTPLHSLSMSIALLNENVSGKIDDKQRKLLDAANEELIRLKSLVNDLLDLSQIETGKMEMQLESIRPSVIVDNVTGVFKTQCEEMRLKIIPDTPDDLPDVQADLNKITWVLSNLVANALRYANNVIGISVQSAGEWLHFSVSDDGDGIPLEYQSRIFEKFVQIKSIKNVGGTGLGLAICREIVRAHKGTIWVNSTPGKGSTFTFALPVEQKA